MLGKSLACVLFFSTLPFHLAEDIPFGTPLGSARGVVGYSNYNDSTISDEDNFVNGVYMGLKWQCVEYARRYLYLTRNMTFQSIEAAIDIWDLTYVTSLATGQKLALIQHPNGDSTLPQEGDLLIWPRQGSDTPYGHVAAIVGVEQRAEDISVFIGEQNFYNQMWEAPTSYTRVIPGKRSGNRYVLSDFGYEITGWMSIGKPPSKSAVAVQPFDASMYLIAIPVLITVVGLAVLAVKSQKDPAKKSRDGHVLLDEDQMTTAKPRLSAEETEGTGVELERVR